MPSSPEPSQDEKQLVPARLHPQVSFESIRRQLNSAQRERLQLYDDGEDLAKYQRQDLETEVRRLRAQMNAHTLEHASGMSETRDLMSHICTGKEFEGYPQINSSPPDEKSLNDILKAAGKRALGGGLPGAAAMAVQVVTLMPMRTVMNTQYRHGGTTMGAFRSLMAQGGVPRLYAGLGPALLQGPLSRFGDTAANAGANALLDSYDATKNLPIAVKTLVASSSAASFRIFLMPIDTVKTIRQVEGPQAFDILRKKFKQGGPRILYAGSLGAASATLAGHFPWFFTYNSLNAYIPKTAEEAGLGPKLARNAAIGFCASVVSDTTSNSLRVTKTFKQTSEVPVTYPEAVRAIIKKDGMQGLFFRGLKTRLLANGLQGAFFSLAWKLFEDKWAKRAKDAEAAAK